MAKKQLTKKSLDNLKPFKEGEDKRRNTTGKNKGSRWKKNLLADLATTVVDIKGNQAFEKVKVQFPEFFDGTEEQNWQLFIEVKQLSLVYHKDPKVSQAAIKEIKDRIEGQSVRKLDHTTDGESIKQMTRKEIEKELNEIIERRERTNK